MWYIRCPAMGVNQGKSRKIGCASGLFGLTAREVEALDYLAQGLIYKEIAEKMGVSYHTVDTHLRHIYRKLGAKSRMQAVAKYRDEQRKISNIPKTRDTATDY